MKDINEDVKSLLEEDYLNEFGNYNLVLLHRNIPPINTFEQKYSPRIKWAYPIGVSPENLDKIKRPDNIVAELNLLRKEKPINREKYKERIIQAVEICLGEKGVKHWKSYLEGTESEHF